MTDDEMVEVIARAIWTTYTNSHVPPEDLRGITWEQLTRWAQERPTLQEIVDLCFAEARAAIRACHAASGLVLREVPGEKPITYGLGVYESERRHGHNAALAAVRALAVEV